MLDISSSSSSEPESAIVGSSVWWRSNAIGARGSSPAEFKDFKLMFWC
jgi:hypothetical protein